MKTFYKFLSILAVPATLLLYSYSGGSPGGKTGSVGDEGKLCNECHSSNIQIENSWITTNIPAEGYAPGETYSVTVSGTHLGVVKFGFELTAENSSGAKQGTIIITESDRTKLVNLNTAATHTSNGTTPSGDSNSWTVDWTAPAEGSGTMFFYSGINAANGNGNTGGDQIYRATISIEENVAVPALTALDPDHAEQGWEGSVTIMGENTSWMQNAPNVTFQNSSNPLDLFSATNINVISDTELTCDVVVDTDQEIGTYNVKVDILVLAEGFTVDVASALGDDLLANTIRAYPNPATNYVNVDLPQGAEIRVVDMLGHQIFVKKNTNLSERIDISNMESGIYFVQVMHESEAATMRIVKR